MANTTTIIDKLTWVASISKLKNKINEILDYLNPQKNIALLITQSAGGVPTASSIGNTTNLGTPVLARSSAGTYTITLAGAFTENKTIGKIYNNISGLNAYTIEWTSANVMTIKTYVLSVDTGTLIQTLTDGLLTATPVEIFIKG